MGGICREVQWSAEQSHPKFTRVKGSRHPIIMSFSSLLLIGRLPAAEMQVDHERSRPLEPPAKRGVLNTTARAAICRVYRYFEFFGPYGHSNFGNLPIQCRQTLTGISEWYSLM